MKPLRTSFEIEAPKFYISHNNHCFFIGSCFSDNIGNFFDKYHFKNLINPFGVVYNPISIHNTLKRIAEAKIYTPSDLHQHNDYWFSFDHYTAFDDIDQKRCLKKLNDTMQNAITFFNSTDLFIISFGTSFIYKHISSQKIVSNCHKMPSTEFEYSLMSFEMTKTELNSILDLIKKQRPNAQVLFTVSPIRHWKDGAILNQQSKSLLLLAIADVVKENESLTYFPAYELVMDDLRDYRFYAEDMIHLNQTAVGYIWERFADTFFESHTKELFTTLQPLINMMNHRPQHKDHQSFELFKNTALKTIQSIQLKIPSLNLDNEIRYFKNL